MVDWLIYIILVGEVSSLSFIENISYGTWLTPFNLLAVPYFVVVSLAFFVAPALGFFQLNMVSVLVWEIGLAIFWIFGSLITAMCFGKKIKRKLRTPDFVEDNDVTSVCLLIAWLIIIISLYSLRVLIPVAGGWSNIGSSEFIKEYGLGWYAHVRVFGVPILIYLIGTVNRKNYFSQLTIIALFIVIAFYQSKGALIAPLAGGLIYRNMIGNKKIRFRQIILFLLSVYLIFNIVYIIGWGASNISAIFNFDNYHFLFKYFFGYLFAGVLGFSQQSRNTLDIVGLNSAVLFAPYINLYSTLMSGKILSPVVTTYYILINNSGFESNVHTFFGVILLFLGILGSYLYVIILSSFIYILFVWSVLTNNKWIKVVYFYIGSLLALGWFEFYFWLLSSIEVPVYTILLAVFFYIYRSFLKSKKTCPFGKRV